MVRIRPHQPIWMKIMFIIENPKMPDEKITVTEISGAMFDFIEATDGFIMVEWMEQYKPFLQHENQQSIFRTIDRIRANIEKTINAIHPKNRSVENVKRRAMYSLDLDMMCPYNQRQINLVMVNANIQSH